MHETPSARQQSSAPTPAAEPQAAVRRAWARPELSALPRLVKLTLQTGGAGGGGAAIPVTGGEGTGLSF